MCIGECVINVCIFQEHGGASAMADGTNRSRCPMERFPCGSACPEEVNQAA